MPFCVAAFAVLLPVAWMYYRGNPVSGYLGPVVEHGVSDLGNRLSGRSDARTLFIGADGTRQPAGYRIIGIASLVLLAAGLATGFFRSLALSAPSHLGTGVMRLGAVLKRRWSDSRIVLLTVAAFGLPLTVAFRLSPAAWEIGNRMSSFVFVSVGLVVAV